MLRSPSLPEIIIKRDEWFQIIDFVRNLPGMENTPEVDCLALYSVCPLSIIDNFTLHAVEVYSSTGGLSRISSPEEYYNLPAIYVSVCKVIEDVKRKLKPKP